MTEASNDNLDVATEFAPFSLEVQLELTDYLRLGTDLRSWWSLLTRRVIAVCLLVYGVNNFYANGFSWLSVIFAYFVIEFGTSYSLAILAMWVFVLRRMRGIRLLTDESGISFEVASPVPRERKVLWSQFRQFGSVKESRNFFWLDWGRGSMWIPKRAFPSNAELARFRQILIEKIGDRCKFMNDNPDQESS